jgi:hypothetical protein
MTDQPIIYWQDDSIPYLTVQEVTWTPRLVCQLNAGDRVFQLDREQARSLGYALIARATVTSDEELRPQYDQERQEYGADLKFDSPEYRAQAMTRFPAYDEQWKERHRKA